MKLGVDCLRNVSNISTDPEDENILIVKFFDTRDAQRMEELVSQTVGPAVEPPPGLALPAGLSPPPGLAMPPPGLAMPPPGLALPAKDTSSAAPAHAELPSDVNVAAGSAENFEVVLQDLPKALCCGDYLEAVLEQAGIDMAVTSCKVLTGSDVGEALLKLTTRRAAKKCVKHFHGRRFDLAGACPPVKATFLQAAEKQVKPSKCRATEVVAIEAAPEVAPAQMEAVMSQFFASEIGKKLLVDQYCSQHSAANEETANFNWEAVSDMSDSEQSRPSEGRKGPTMLSDASTVDGNSDTGEQEVF
jgi:hypothetical protein